MAKKESKIAEASASRPKRDRRTEASAPDWGRAGPPPSPTITPVSARKDRPRRRHRPFVDHAGQPSPVLAELMGSPASAPPLLDGSPILEAGALACRRLKNGELSVLLVSKRRSGKWGIPKGRLNGRLTFGEVAAKEAFEEAGIKGRISPGSVGMFRMKKRTPSRQYSRVVEVWVYLMEVTERLHYWPEKGKREIRWVSCETAARQLREPALAELCQRLERG
jgi:8-oxo-dGTP pyrophosphatase MutT (NUDIX family)